MYEFLDDFAYKIYFTMKMKQITVSARVQLEEHTFVQTHAHLIHTFLKQAFHFGPMKMFQLVQ